MRRRRQGEKGLHLPPIPTIKVGVRNLGVRFIRKTASWSGIYLWGYFGFSPGWLLAPLILSVLGYQWKKEQEYKISSAQLLADSNEKEVILARVQDLPSWVFFPDFERSEWLNRVVEHLWPAIGHFTALTVTSLEPLIQKSLERFSMKDFKFDHVLLGNIPPKIGGIKCYGKTTSRNEIILDMEVTWASDSDITVQIKRMKASVLDLYIHGNLRVVLKPILPNLPFIGGMQLYFLNNPGIDFAVGGLANVTDLPGINSILRRVIAEQLAQFMVLPNKISFPFVDEVPLKVFKCPEPEGVLRITIVEATNLMQCDIGLFGRGQSDPYVVLTIGAKKFRSQTVKKTVNPVFGESWESVVEIAKSQSLDIEVWDQDQGKDDDFMGRARIPIQVLAERGESEMWFMLEDASSGQVKLRTEWFRLSSDPEDLDVRLEEVGDRRLATAVLMVFVDSCKQLPLAKGPLMSGKPDPSVQVSVSRRQEERVETRCVRHDRNPVYEEGFTLLVSNPELDDLNLKVYDERYRATLGLLRLNLANLVNRGGMEYLNQPFKLKNTNGCESSVILSLQLFFTKKVTRVRSLSEDLDTVSQAGDLARYQREKKLSILSGISVALEDDAFIGQDEALTLNESADTSKTDGPDSGVIGPRVLLSVCYEPPARRLRLTVHRARELPLSEKQSDLPDPFVKILLLPDRARKRKTETVSSSLNPVWDETSEFSMEPEALKEKKIELVVLDRKGLFTRSAPLCQCVVQLWECGDLTKETFHRWLPLLISDSSKPVH